MLKNIMRNAVVYFNGVLAKHLFTQQKLVETFLCLYKLLLRNDPCILIPLVIKTFVWVLNAIVKWYDL